MFGRSMQRVLRELRRAAGTTRQAERPDADLLRSFLDHQDEDAFTAIVRRHAGMVLGVCGRVAGDPHDAEDAFQAVFCVLLRKAASIRRREVLGSWLYGVAYRTALAARVRRAKRGRRERQVDGMPDPIANPSAAQTDWQPVLDAALERLAEKHRAPIILCDLEGKSRKEAALMLGLTEGTLSSRLARGRRLLAQRLKRHGVVLSGGALAGLLAESAVAASSPAALIQTVVQAGAQVLTGHAPASLAFGGRVLELTEATMKAMLLGKLKTLTAIVVIAAAATTGSVWLWSAQAAQDFPGGVERDSPIQAGRPSPRNIPLESQSVRTSPEDEAVYTIELSATLPDSAGKPKTSQPPRMTVPLRQRMAFYQTDKVIAPQPLPVVGSQFHWQVELIHARGTEILVALALGKKERISNALVHGQSLDFEDFIRLGEVKEINDASWPGASFKIKVTAVDLNEPIVPPARTAARKAPPAVNVPAGSGANPLTGKLPWAAHRAPDAPASFRVFKLEHAEASHVAESLQKMVATNPDLRVYADPRSNSIVIQAKLADQEKWATLVKQLDSAGRDTDAKAGEIAAKSPDGKRLAMAAGDFITIFDTQTGQIIAKMQDKSITALAYSPDGKMLASGSRAGHAVLWDGATGKQLRRLAIDEAISAVQFFPDGGVLNVIGADREEYLFNIQTGDLVKRSKAQPK